MKVLIVGAGKLGYKLASSMLRFTRDVTVIDTDQRVLSRMGDNIDVMTLCASGIDMDSLREAGVGKCDLAVAATERDEINILACSFAKKLGCKRTVARVRNPEFVRQQANIQTMMDIDMVINPERATAECMARYLFQNYSFNTNRFADGRISVIDVPAHSVSQWVDKRLMDIAELEKLLVVGISRSGEMIIPDGSTVVGPEDLLYVSGNTDDIDKLVLDSSNELTKNVLRNVMIVGGGRLGLYLAEMLIEGDVSVKIIERDAKQCEYLSSALRGGALVLCGDGSDAGLLAEEGIRGMDAFIGATGYDEANLLMALMARQSGVPKVLAKVSKSNYVPIIEKLGVDVVMSTIDITVSSIMKFARGGQVMSVSMMLGGGAEVLDILADSTMPIANRSLEKLRLPKGVIIGSVLKGDRVIIPNGATVIEDGDRFVAFCLENTLPALNKFLRSEKKEG